MRNDPQRTKELIEDVFFDLDCGNNISQRKIDPAKLKQALLEIVERIDALYGVVNP